MYFDDRLKRVGNLLYMHFHGTYMIGQAKTETHIVFYNNYVMYIIIMHVNSVIVRTGHLILPVLTIPYQRVYIHVGMRLYTHLGMVQICQARHYYHHWHNIHCTVRVLYI